MTDLPPPRGVTGHSDDADSDVRDSRWLDLALVFAGGTIGTAARVTLTLIVPPVAGFPLATFAANLLGAFLLGLLLESLARRGDDTGTRRRVRLLFGTGVLGGFTTYSALATEAAVGAAADPMLAAVYAATTVAVGVLAAWAGIAAGARRRGAGPRVPPHRAAGRDAAGRDAARRDGDAG